MLDQPKITPSSDAEWKEYYHRKLTEVEKQLATVSACLPHCLRLAMEGKKKDSVMLFRRVANILKYPRDKDPLVAELRKYTDYMDGILRGEETPHAPTN